MHAARLPGWSCAIVVRMVLALAPLLAGTLALPTGASASTYSDRVLAAFPSAYWRLDESTGTNAADSASTNTGTYVGSVSLSQPGALTGDPDTAAGLDGTTGTVQIPSTTGVSPSGPLTVEAWIKPTSLPAAGASSMILRKDSQYQLSITSSGALGFRLFQGGVAQEVDAPAGTASPGAWSHVVGMWNGTKMTLYVNGGIVASAALSGSVDSTTTRPFLGSAYDSWGFFSGVLDEVAIYPHALSNSEIQAHYQIGVTGQAPPPPPPPQPSAAYASAVAADSPAGYWRLGEASGTTAADQTGAST
jgi:Concanavalin A-like lectin/glucanases superfamily